MRRCFFAFTMVVLALAGSSALAATPAGAVDPPGTILVSVSGAPGSYAYGFCPTSTTFLPWGNAACADGSPNFAGFLSQGSSVAVSVPAGSYNGVLATGPGAFGPDGPVTVIAGQTTTCTLSMTAAPSCTSGPPTGTVVVTVGELSGSYASGLCLTPGLPVTGSPTCSDGSSANVQFGLAPGSSTTYSLTPGTYTGGLAALSPLAGGVYGPVYVTAGATANCTFTLAAAPSCVYPGPVTLVPAVGGSPVTIQSNTGTTLSAVTATLPAIPPPAGATLPVGVLGFQVNVANPGDSADVTVTLPAGSNPTGYLKFQNNVWVDFSSNATIAGDVVTLHLVDGGAGDGDGAADGVIVDPGAPIVGYGFGGFAAPVDGGKVNLVKAGRTIPVKWRVVDAAGAPVSDPASFVDLTSSGGACGTAGAGAIETHAPGSSGLKYGGDGQWHLNWKTSKAWSGECRTLTLRLDDGTSHTAQFRFK